VSQERASFPKWTGAEGSTHTSPQCSLFGSMCAGSKSLSLNWTSTSNQGFLMRTSELFTGHSCRHPIEALLPLVRIIEHHVVEPCVFCSEKRSAGTLTAGSLLFEPLRFTGRAVPVRLSQMPAVAQNRQQYRPYPPHSSATSGAPFPA